MPRMRNIVKFTPSIEFENQKFNLADERPDLYQPMMKRPDRCSNENCRSNKNNYHSSLTVLDVSISMR